MLKGFELWGQQCDDKKTRVVEKNVWEEKKKRNESLKDNIVLACNAHKYFCG